MTLKNKIAAITAASMVAFVGIGFAAWTFNEGHAQEAEESAYGIYIKPAMRVWKTQSFLIGSFMIKGL